MHFTFSNILCVLTVIVLSCQGVLHAREFTDIKGRKIEAEIIKIEDDNVTINRGGDRYTVKTNIFSEADQEFIRNWQAPQKTHVPKVSKHGISDAPGLAEYTSGIDTFDGGKFWIYVPENYNANTPMPLVMSSHGNYSATENLGLVEINGWKKIADEHGLIVVCPSFAIAHREGPLHSSFAELVDVTKKTLDTIMERVLESFNIDRRHVLATGHSGGGYPTWVAMEFPDVFTALCFRGANYETYVPDHLKMSKVRKWNKRPVYYFIGKDDTVIPGEDQTAAIEFLRKLVDKEFLTIDILPGVGHERLDSRAAEWFLGTISSRPKED